MDLLGLYLVCNLSSTWTTSCSYNSRFTGEWFWYSQKLYHPNLYIHIYMMVCQYIFLYLKFAYLLTQYWNSSWWLIFYYPIPSFCTTRKLHRLVSYLSVVARMLILFHSKQSSFTDGMDGLLLSSLQLAQSLEWLWADVHSEARSIPNQRSTVLDPWLHTPSSWASSIASTRGNTGSGWWVSVWYSSYLCEFVHWSLIVISRFRFRCV